jgi:PAS domain S-box-containing protein
VAKADISAAASDGLTLDLDTDAVVLGVDLATATQPFMQVPRIGESLPSHVHPDDCDLFALMLQVTPDRGSRPATLRLRFARGDGRWAHMLATFRAADGGCVRVTLEPDELAAALRAEKQMRQVVEGSAQGIIVRTATEVLYMNNSFAKLLGYSSPRECVDSEPFIDSIIHPDDRKLVLDHLAARVAGRETVSHYDFRLLRRDRSVVWVEAYASMVAWNGQPASLSWLSDISEHKALEAKLRTSKEEAEYANRTKTEFLANMSHELRTPLNAILGLSEVMTLKMFGPISARYAEYAADIHGSGQHLLELVNDVLDLSKLDASKLELRETSFDLAALTAEVANIMSNRAVAAEVAMRVDVEPGGIWMRADQRSIKQILLNLVSNAIKFTPEDGRITVRAVCDADRRICLSVSDTGIGMSATEVPIALSSFGQIDSWIARKHEGTGLGLPICKSLVQLHGGDLIVASEPDRGTSVTARFPPSRTIPLPAQRAASQ